MSSSATIDVNWVELFSCCTNVITVRAIGDGASSFVQAITASTVTNAESSKGGRKWKHDNRESTLVQPASTVTHAHAAVFPKLMSLGLTWLKFADGDHPDSGILFDVFERGLQQRMAASGAPLKLLCITGCDISTEHANDLKKLVEKFHWDEDKSLTDGCDALNDCLFEGGCNEYEWDSDEWDSDEWDTDN